MPAPAAAAAVAAAFATALVIDISPSAAHVWGRGIKGQRWHCGVGLENQRNDFVIECFLQNTKILILPSS